MPSTSRITFCAGLRSPNLRRIKFDRRAFTTPDANSRSLTPLIHFDLQSLSGGVRDDSVRVECRPSAWKKIVAVTKMHRHSRDSSSPSNGGSEWQRLDLLWELKREGLLTLDQPQHSRGRLCHIHSRRYSQRSQNRLSDCLRYSPVDTRRSPKSSGLSACQHLH